MPDSYPPRIQAFREEIIKTLPRAPNTRDSLEALRAMPSHGLILAFVTWRMRFIPARPRLVRFWSGGALPFQFRTVKPRLQPFLEKVASGKDLTPYLSDLVNRRGIVLSGAKRQDIDMVLTRQGLHHFHVGTASSANPKGRSGTLIFAEVLETEFRVVAISDHRAFVLGSPEQQRFFRICTAYMAKDVPPGQGFMANPVMASGHSMLVTLFADKCDDEMRRLDPLLDDPAFIDKLYQDQPIMRDGQPVTRPEQPLMSWYFDDLKFGILDKGTMVFFCIFPFFSR
jgi:hypothetical protein